MKKILLFVCFLTAISLCACGPKPQPAPTAAPTDMPAAVPAGPAAAEETKEETKDEGPAADAAAVTEAVPETYDPSNAGSVLEYYDAHAEEIFGSFAYMQLDTAGKKTWTAPLAGIKEFRVPEAFLNAKGGVRASGGKELFSGKGIVSLDIVYLPYTEDVYDALLDRLAEFRKEHQIPTEEDMDAYSDMISEYNDGIYLLFKVFGIGENKTADELISSLKENYLMQGAPEADVDEYLNSFDFAEAGSAEDYRFYLAKSRIASESFEETGSEYKDEYDALCDAYDTFAANFTFMRPLALAQLVPEGTGFTFETKDLNGDPVSGSDLFGGHKVTMLNIWETTCSACMSEMLDITELAEKVEAAGGQVVGLVYDATDDEMIAEAKEIETDLGLNFLNLTPTQEMKDFFKVQAFPATYFFNEKGEVLGEPIMGALPKEYARRMDELLGK